MTIKKIRGAKGGKGGEGGTGAKEASDNLRSKQIATVIDILCEGPIVGLVNGAASIFINETPLKNADGSGLISDGPLQNSDGTFNFVDVSAQWRTGTQNQLPLEGISDVESETGVGVEVKQAVPIIKTITNQQASSVRVTVSVPVLTTQDPKTGDLNGGSVEYTIDTRSNGGSWVTRVSDTITGKTTTKYQRASLISLDGNGPWDVRVVRVTPDAPTSNVQNKLFFDSYTDIIEARLTYPNSAIVGMRIDASQFGSIPGRAYGIRGLIVSVPSNYDPATRTYTGIWDGYFKQSWTDNPAWCFYDLLTAKRYGLGDYIPESAVDKWALYSIAKYCDELVPTGYKDVNGNPKMEPRFTCNLYLQSQEEAYNVIQNFASIFRAITFWGAGSITAVQDSPKDPVALFTNSNVVEGVFNYEGSSIKQRHTVALVSWNDPKDFYRQKVEYVQDDDAVKKYGVIKTEITAFGCSSRGQANRMGRWMLATEKYAAEMVTFKTGLDGAFLYPGAIISTSDLLRAGTRMGGRLKDSTAATLNLDKPVTLLAGKTYTITAVLPSGALETKTVTNAAGTYSALILQSPMTDVPLTNAVFILTASDLVPQTWRILGATESGKNEVTVSAIAYVPSLYAYVEQNLSFTPPKISAIKAVPDAPTALNVSVSRYQIAGAMVGLKATLSWQGDAASYVVAWRRSNGVWTERTVYEPTIDIDNIDYDTYSFSVVAQSTVGRQSAPVTLTQTLAPSSIGLPNVTNLVLEGMFTADVAKIKWDAVAGATSYEVKVIVGGATKRTVNVGAAQRYEYTAKDMKADGGPWRNITLSVTGQGALGASSTAAATLAINNPQIGPLAGISLDSGVNAIHFKCQKPTDDDFAGMLVYVGTTAGFTPDASTLAYDGPDVSATIVKLPNGDPFAVGTDYFVKAAAYDVFGKDSLNMSNSVSAKITQLAPSADSITADMIKAGVLDATKFASGIEPVTMVSAVPTTKTTSTIFNTTDGKLYRWDGTKYSATIPAADITGKLSDTQIAEVAASKMTGQLTNTQIKDIDAAKMTGQLVDTQLAEIAANKVSGQLSNAQIAAIDAAKVTGKLASAQIDLNIGGANLVGNSSFEKDDGGGRPLGFIQYNNASIPTAYVRPVGRRGGLAYGLKALATTNQTFGVLPFTDALCDGHVQGGWQPGKKYVLSFYAKKVNGANMTTMALRWNTWPSVTEIINPVLTGSYQRYAFLLQWGGSVEANGTFYIDALTNGLAAVANDEIHIDDVQVEDGDTLTAYAPKPGEILPGSITSTEVADNGITTPKLVTGAVVSSKIAAAAITADKLAIGTGRNLLRFSTFPISWLGWTIDANSTGMTLGYGKYDNNIYNFNNENAYHNVSGRPGADTYVSARQAELIGVTAGAWYEASAYVATHRCKGQVMVNWYDINRTYISNATVYGNVADNLNRQFNSLDLYVRSWVNAKAPDNACYAAFYVLSTYDGNQDNPHVWYLRCFFGESNPNQTSPSAWSPAGVTSINGGQIDTDSITANQIAAGAISTDELAANAVTATKILAGTITGDRIAGNTITGSLIQAGTITADKLLVTSRGTALNEDPFFEDFANAWAKTASVGLAYLTSAPGAAGGNYAYVSDGTTDQFLTSIRPTAIDPAKTYSLTARLYSSGADTRDMYVFVDMYDVSGAQVPNTVTHWGGSKSGYTFGGGVPGKNTWIECGGQFGAGTNRPIPPNVAKVFIGIWFNYSSGGTSGFQGAQSIRLERVNDGQLIVDGAITATKVAAGAITADKIAANAVTANAIAANAIVAKHLVVQNNDDVCPDPTFSDPTFWSNGVFSSWPAGFSPMASDTWPTTQALLIQNTTINCDTRRIPVEKNASYYLRVWIYKNPGTSGNFSPVFHVPGVEYNPMGLPRTGSYNAWAGAPDINWAAIPDGTWTLYEAFPIASPSYDYFQFIFHGNVSGAVYMGFQLTRRASANLIVDGAITSAKLTADSVTAGKIAAGAISAREIQAGAISVQKLAVVAESLCPDPYFNDMAWWGASLINPGWYAENNDGAGNVPSAMGVGRCATLNIGSIGTARAHLWSGGLPFSGRGQTVRLRARMFNNSNQQCVVAVRFHDKTGTVILDAVLISNPGEGNADRNAQSPVPDSCTRISFLCYNYSGFNGTGFFGVSEVKLDVANSGEMLVDGCITAGKLVAGAVTSDKISVNQLSAITQDVGLLRTATIGGRQEISGPATNIYDTNNALRVEIGYLP